MHRKDAIITILATFCLSFLILVVVPIKSGQPYDPWTDIDENGKIDMRDIGTVASRFGTSGEPTRTVNVINSHFEWYSREVIEPRSYWSFLNDTAGYRQVNIRMTSNDTVNVALYFGILDTNQQYITAQDLFDIQADETVFKTYEVKGPTLQLYVFNPSATTVASLFIAVYVTT